jgi:polyisoprenoid-binding protein YceI
VATTTRSRLPIVLAVVVAVLIVGVGAFFYLTRDTSDPELALTDSPEGSGETLDAATLDGAWTVVPGPDGEATQAGYRVDEVFAAGAREATANGRTGGVEGDLTVADGTVTEASFIVDVSTLTSDEGRRDNAIRDRGLETDTYPEATFELTEPIELPEIVDGATVEVPATGELTLRDVTNEVTLDLTVRAVGARFAVQGAAPVAFTDYDIEPPNIGGFVTVEDNGSFEFLVNLEAA